MKTNAGLKNPVLKITVITSTILFVISLFLPSFHIEGRNKEEFESGIFLFTMGWAALFTGNPIATVIWLANPLYIIALLRTRKGKGALVLVAVATVLAFGFMLVGSVVADESGEVSKITARLSGYWLWTTGIAMLTTGLLINKSTNRGPQTLTEQGGS